MQTSTTSPDAQLDAQVTQRLELLDRWTKAIRHDLGNVLYPSRNLLAGAAEEGGRAGELAERVRDLMDMIDECRLSLLNFRPVNDDDASGAVVPADWWRQTRHLMKAALCDTRMAGPTTRDLALPVSSKGLTRMVLPILLAMDAQYQGRPPEVVSFETGREPMTFSIKATGAGMAEPCLPAMAHQTARRLGCRLETRRHQAQAGEGWCVTVEWPAT